MQDACLYIGDWRLDLHANAISNKEEVKRLEHKQIQLLLYFIANAGRTISKIELLEAIWTGRVVVDDVVAVAVSQLRKAFNDLPRSPKLIKTIRGAGYRFIYPVNPQEMTRARRYLGSADTPEAASASIEPASSETLRHSKFHVYHWSIGGFLLLSCLAIAGAILFINHPPDNIETATNVEPALLARYERARQLRFTFESAKQQQAITLLEDTIRQAPDFADAYVLLAQLKRDRVFHNPPVEYQASAELQALLNKAIALQPQSSVAHETLGNILLFVDWNHDASRKHLEKALALNAQNGAAHHLYGLYWLAHGRFEPSYDHITKAREIDPLYYSAATIAWVFAMQGRYEEAWQETEKLLTYKPDELQYHRSALRLWELQGDQARAYKHLRAILTLANYNIDELEKLDAIFNHEQLAGVYHWMAYTRRDERDIGFYAPPLSFARFAIAAGQYDDAFRWLEQAKDQRQRELLWLGVDPKYDPLRGDPRFKALIRELGLRL